jgi:hypothetical protein
MLTQPKTRSLMHLPYHIANNLRPFIVIFVYSQMCTRVFLCNEHSFN